METQDNQAISEKISEILRTSQSAITSMKNPNLKVNFDFLTQVSGYYQDMVNSSNKISHLSKNSPESENIGNNLPTTHLKRR